MAIIKNFNLGALNLKINPLALDQGQVIHALNVERDLVGAYKKRSGYVTFLGTPDNNQVNSLFSWTQNDGTSLFVYRASGSSLYHSTNGTQAWTLSGAGTITDGAHFGHTVLDNILIGGDGTAATRHSTAGVNGQAGTGFVNTTNAPLAELWENYQGRAWAARGTGVAGTNIDMIYSTVGTATDWTTDSSSIRVPGAGRINTLFKAGDRLIPSLDSGQMFRWDGFSLVDLATNMGPSSPYSVGEIEDFKMFINRRGFWGYGGGKPEILSNPIERQIFNDLGSAVAGTTFDNAPGIAYRYDYFCGVGTITDDLIYETIPNCVMKYDVQLDEWVNWSFANRPTAFGTFQDLSGDEQLIFGDSGGQCYQMAGTATSDNGAAIPSGIIGFIAGQSLEQKEWKYIRGLFNPGCRAMISFAVSDTFTPRTLNWIDIGDAKDGVVEYRFKDGARGVFLFYKIYESSRDQPYQFYGWEISANLVSHA